MFGRAGVLVAALVAATLTLSACSADVVPGVGGDDIDTANGKKAKATVERFAEADGPQACEMFTPAGLRQVYGKDEPPGPPPELEQPLPAISLAECRRRSARFSGADVNVTKVDLVGDRAAKVEATTDDGDRNYTITVRRKGDQWLIDEIREK
jgi:hypothetical protein